MYFYTCGKPPPVCSSWLRQVSTSAYLLGGGPHLCFNSNSQMGNLTLGSDDTASGQKTAWAKDVEHLQKKLVRQRMSCGLTSTSFLFFLNMMRKTWKQLHPFIISHEQLSWCCVVHVHVHVLLLLNLGFFSCLRFVAQLQPGRVNWTPFVLRLHSLFSLL